MNTRTDIKTTDIVDNSIDLMFKNGDFFIGPSIEQEIGMHLKYTKGQLRQDITIGIGADFIQNGYLTDDMKNKIREELKEDGIKVTNITYDNNTKKIIVNYE